MSQSVIGALRVNLGLDSAQFEKGAKKVQDPLRDMRNQFLAVSAAAAAFGAAIFTAARKGADEIDRAAKAARRLDLGIGAFRGLELAASEAGIPLSALTNDIQNVNREIANIGVSGNAERALQRLGMSIDDISGLDATDKIAAIADRVRDLGLSSGEATAILRDLGVRNREMVLLLTAGGDAIRQARSDIEDYGLAVSEVDASRIEAANDAIGRLGLITQYAGQQLALALVPALGRMAEAMTDSLRAGGALRSVIDALTGNIERILTYMATAVALFGTRYVGALLAARLSTLSLAGSLAVLRGALVRLGIGALIVGAGELIYWFGRLVTGAGGFGEALKLLGAVAAAVWKGIQMSAEGLDPALRGIWASIESGFLSMLASLQEKWADFLRTISSELRVTPGFEGIGEDLFGASITARSGSYTSQLAADAAGGRATALLGEAGAIVRGAFSGVDDALGQLRDAVTDVGDAAPDASDSLDRMAGATEEVGAAGGGASGAMKTLAESLTPVQEAVKEFSAQLGQELSNAFSSVVSGSKSAGEALRDFANNVLSQLANRIFQNTIGNSITGALTNAVTGWITGGASAAPAAQALVTPKGEGGISALTMNIRAEGVAVEAQQNGNMIDMVLRQAESQIAGSIARGGQVAQAINQTYQLRPGLARRG